MGGGSSTPYVSPAERARQQRVRQLHKARKLQERRDREEKRRKEWEKKDKEKKAAQKEKEDWLKARRLGYEERMYLNGFWWRLPFVTWWKERRAWNKELKRRRMVRMGLIKDTTVYGGLRDGEEIPLKDGVGSGGGDGEDGGGMLIIQHPDQGPGRPHQD